MLRKEQNDLLTKTGPGTPMGQIFRSYWIPALRSQELPENDWDMFKVGLALTIVEFLILLLLVPAILADDRALTGARTRSEELEER